MARLPKVEPAGLAAPGGTEDSPFALPVARNLGPKPGESLFASPPSVAEPKLPDARPKEPPQDKPEPKKEASIIEPSKPAPIEPVRVNQEEEAAEEEEDADSSAALFLPSSTKEIVVEPSSHRARPDVHKEPEAETKSVAEPIAAKASTSDEQKPAATADTKPPAGRQTAVYLAAMAGAALGLLSLGAIYMMLGSEPQGAAPPTRSSPFGKRSTGDSTMVPVLDDPAPAPKDPPGANRSLTAPMIESPDDEPQPTSIRAPSVSRPVEPPTPGAIVSAPTQPAPALAPAPAPVPAPPVVVAPPKVAPYRPAATFVQTEPPKRAEKPKRPAPVAAPKKVLGPQWVFEGAVYDLITTQGVYGVRLVFLDEKDNEVASVVAGGDGQYRVSMDVGPAAGYTLRIVHDDYSGKRIDELDSTTRFAADLEQRKFLMQAGHAAFPWIGSVGKPVRRDMALVPNVPAE